MKLKSKLPIFTSLTVFLSVVIIAGYSIYNYREKTLESIEQYRVEEIEKLKNHMKDIVNIAHSMIDYSYENSSSAGIKKRYGFDLTDSVDANIKMVAVNMLKVTVENLRVLRFGVDGYLWINSVNAPYTVIMHATRPEIEGKANFWEYYTTGKNLYQVFADKLEENEGEAFVPYMYIKPITGDTIEKLSYIKLHEPLGWVIGTGVYYDHIDKIVASKTELLNMQIVRLVRSIIFIMVGLIVLASVILYFFGASIVNPLQEIQNLLSDMSKGYEVKRIALDRNDEIGQMNYSLDALIDGFASYSRFAREIGKGNLNSDFKLLSQSDQLGNSLLEMRESLKQARIDEENRQRENAIQQWISSGQALFGDILRAGSGNIKQLSVRVLRELATYVHSEIGGFFILNDSNPDNLYLEQTAAIAYHKDKYANKIVYPGEGMIGACFLEKEKIYMTHIPENYIEIKSGLGEIKPTNLLIVPFIFENVPLGIIELASLKPFMSYEIGFIERISESIAISIASSRISQD